jgi:hypothetical protein
MSKFKVLYNFTISKLTLLFFLFLIFFTVDRHHRYEFTTNLDKGPFEYDVAEYYSYLPLLFYGSPEQRALNYKENKRTIGMAVMYSPAFFVGHILAKISDENINGYSKSYQWAIRWGSILFCLAGLWFTRKSLLLFFNETITLISLVCIFFSTNLFFYTYSSGELPHSYLFFLFSVFLFLSLKIILENKYKYILLLGFIGGLIILIRPTAGLILLFPLLFKIKSIKDFKERLRILSQNRSYFFSSLILFIIPLLIQAFIWKKYTGTYFFYSYKSEHFFFNDPQIINFLFSYRKGWLVYTPIMVFSLIGILLSGKYLKEFFCFLILFMALNIYILSSWWDWSFGGSFGCRVLIESYAVLAFPFALFIDCCWTLFKKYNIGKIIFRILLILVLFLFIKLNLFQTWQYKYLIIHWSGMNEKAYKYVFLKERLTKEELLFLHDSIVTPPNLEKMINGIRDNQ